MRVFIYRHGNAYKIYKDSKDNLLYVGEWFNVWREGQQLLLNDLEGNPILTVKEKNFRWLQWSWNVIYRLVQLTAQPHEFEITCIEYLHQHWQMTNGEERYDYYGHQGHLKSVFKNDIQIAKIDTEAFRWFDRDTICIDLDNDINPLLMVGLALTFDIGSDNSDATFTFDFGRHHGSKGKRYNNEWRPK